MAVTYTEHYHLGLQEDKSDKLNWDLIVSNWKKIDKAIYGMQNSGYAVGLTSGYESSISGEATDVEENT